MFWTDLILGISLLGYIAPSQQRVKKAESLFTRIS